MDCELKGLWQRTEPWANKSIPWSLVPSLDVKHVNGNGVLVLLVSYSFRDIFSINRNMDKIIVLSASLTFTR